VENRTKSRDESIRDTGLQTGILRRSQQGLLTVLHELTRPVTDQLVRAGTCYGSRGIMCDTFNHRFVEYAPATYLVVCYGGSPGEPLNLLSLPRKSLRSIRVIIKLDSRKAVIFWWSWSASLDNKITNAEPHPGRGNAKKTYRLI